MGGLPVGAAVVDTFGDTLGDAVVGVVGAAVSDTFGDTLGDAMVGAAVGDEAIVGAVGEATTEHVPQSCSSYCSFNCAHVHSRDVV